MRPTETIQRRLTGCGRLTDYLQIDLSKSSHGVEEIAEVAFINPKEHDVRPKFFSQEPLAEDARSGATKFFSYLS